jgi:uncharacterized protein
MPGILCEHCTGYCCRYIALPIETPESRADLDYVRWYLLHEHVSVFIEDGDWYISFATSCRHLQSDYRCGIYETRPKICRDYSTGNCDYHSGDYGWDHHFSSPEHLDEYIKLHWKPRKKRGTRKTARKRRGGLRVRRPVINYAAATSDARGVPLPILAMPRA